MVKYSKIIMKDLWNFFKIYLLIVVVVTIIFLIKKLMITKNLEKIEVDDELKEKLNKLVN
jgi:hypothetical protein